MSRNRPFKVWRLEWYSDSSKSPSTIAVVQGGDFVDEGVPVCRRGGSCWPCYSALARRPESAPQQQAGQHHAQDGGDRHLPEYSGACPFFQADQHPRLWEAGQRYHYLLATGQVSRLPGVVHRAVQVRGGDPFQWGNINASEPVGDQVPGICPRPGEMPAGRSASRLGRESCRKTPHCAVRA